MVKGALQREWPPPEAHSMQMVGPWGRYLPQWLRAPCKGSGPAICQHTHTHTLDLYPTTMSVLETPFDITCQLCTPNTHMHAGPYTYTLYISKQTHNKGSRTRPIMSTLMPRSGIPVICSRATLSCDSSYLSYLLCNFANVISRKVL